MTLPSGCSIDAPESAWGDQNVADAGSPTQDFGGDTSLGEGIGAGTMTGTWLQGVQGSTCVLGNEQVTHTWFIVNIKQEERLLYESRTVCRVEPSKLLTLEIVIPDEARESVVYQSEGVGQITSLLVGGSYASPQEVAQWGLDLENPITDAIPKDAEDPRVIDGDKDGNPGLTFGFVGSECERYSSQRQLTQYFGALYAPNEVRGTSLAATDVEVYGSSQQLCGIAVNVQPNNAYNMFRMVRVDGLGGALDADYNGDGEITCDEVAPLLDELMPKREPNHDNCKR